MSSISFSGLASGLDTDAIVTGLVNAEKIPLTQLQSREAGVTSAQNTISTLTAKYATLRAAALALSTSTGFASYKSSSSATNVVATTTGVANPGTTDVVVGQLAKEQRTFSNTQSSSTAAMSMSGSLSIQVGSGTAANVSVDATDSLTDVAAKINQSGARVNASVMFDGTNYRLQVRGLDTGAANAVTFGETGTSLGLSTPANTYQAAQNANLTVDGVAITRSTNQIAGVIPGVTLAITAPGSSTVSVTNDSDGLGTKVKALVDAYNDVVNTSHFATGYGGVKTSNAELMGDWTLRSALDRLATSVGSVVPGTTGKFTTLGSIGVSSTKDGTLAIDSTKLNQVLQSNPQSVAALFVEDAQSGTTGAMKGLLTTVDALATNSNSVLSTKSDSLAALLKRLGQDEDAMNRHLTDYEATLRKQFTALESLMSSITSNGNALISALGASSK